MTSWVHRQFHRDDGTQAEIPMFIGMTGREAEIPMFIGMTGARQRSRCSSGRRYGIGMTRECRQRGLVIRSSHSVLVIPTKVGISVSPC